MPPIRKTDAPDSPTKKPPPSPKKAPSTPKKAPQSPRKVKKDESGSKEDGTPKIGPWSPEEERQLYLIILAKLDFKLTKEIQREVAEKLGRSLKAIDNFWHRGVSKQLKEIRKAQEEDGIGQEDEEKGGKVQDAAMSEDEKGTKDEGYMSE